MLEERITTLTNAINNLIDILQTQGSALPVQGKEIPTTQPTDKRSPPTVVEQPKPTGQEPSIDVEQARRALVALFKAKGKDAAKEVLAEFGAVKVGDLKATDYPDVIELAHQKALAQAS